MAVTSLWKITSNLNNTVKYIENKDKTLKGLDNVISYANNEDKTEKQYYITGINCNVSSACEEMKNVKIVFNKTSGILGYHGYQSFGEGEVNPDIAHEIGIKLANEMWGDRFQVIVSTHLNTNHIHNHFVVNSVSFIDGKKFNSCRATTAQLRALNDSICNEYNLSALKEKTTSKNKMDFSYYLKSDREHKTNYYESTKRDVDMFIKIANNYSEFLNILKNNNYTVENRYGKLSIRNNKYKRNIRIERYFGEDYSIDNIKQRIIEERFDYSYVNDEYITFNRYLKNHNYKHKGIIGLYKYYCYLLKIYPVKKSYYPSVLKEDLEQLEKYNKINVFIDKYDIHDDIEFNKIEAILLEEQNDKFRSRQNLRQEYKKNKSSETLKNIKILNNEINDINDELNICYLIKNNQKHIDENIKKLEKERKEIDKNESIK